MICTLPSTNVSITRGRPAGDDAAADAVPRSANPSRFRASHFRDGHTFAADRASVRYVHAVRTYVEVCGEQAVEAQESKPLTRTVRGLPAQPRRSKVRDRSARHLRRAPAVPPPRHRHPHSFRGTRCPPREVGHARPEAESYAVSLLSPRRLCRAARACCSSIYENKHTPTHRDGESHRCRARDDHAAAPQQSKDARKRKHGEPAAEPPSSETTPARRGEVRLYLHRGLYHSVQGTMSERYGAPHVVFAPNAGLAAYPTWMETLVTRPPRSRARTLDRVHERRVALALWANLETLRLIRPSFRTGGVGEAWGATGVLHRLLPRGGQHGSTGTAGGGCGADVPHRHKSLPATVVLHRC